MKKVLLLTVLILLLSSVYLFSAVPCKINYQGRLIKDNVPVDEPVNMEFKLYTQPTEGTPIKTISINNVPVHNGLFRVVLDLEDVNWTAGQELYLEVKVGTDILTPREQLYAYPYAINSHLLEGRTTDYFLNTSAETQTKQGDLKIEGILNINAPDTNMDALKVHSGNTYGLYVSTAGKVGIGTTSLGSYTLNVDGGAKIGGDLEVTGSIKGGEVVQYGESLPLKFEVYNPDTVTYAYVEKDLEDYCGDEDGCTIRLLLQHEIDGNDQVRVIDELIYMEQTELSGDKGAGICGWTRQRGGGDYSWITGSTGRYTIFDAWSWIWAFNYRHDYLPGQAGNGPPFSNPYKFLFMSHPHIRTTVIVYD